MISTLSILSMKRKSKKERKRERTGKVGREQRREGEVGREGETAPVRTGWCSTQGAGSACRVLAQEETELGITALKAFSKEPCVTEGNLAGWGGSPRALLSIIHTKVHGHTRPAGSRALTAA